MMNSRAAVAEEVVEELSWHQIFSVRVDGCGENFRFAFLISISLNNSFGKFSIIIFT